MSKKKCCMYLMQDPVLSLTALRIEKEVLSEEKEKK